jgi:DNA primase
MDPSFLKTLEKDARRAGVAAPFLDGPVDRARALWREAFDLLIRLESLERAVEEATRDLSRDGDSTTLITLKAERDHLRKLINSDWSSGEADAPPKVLPH